MIDMEGQYTRQALINYSKVFLLCLVVLALSYSQGLESQFIILKLLAVPLFWLALHGPDTIFKSPVYEGKFTIRALEYSLIYGFVFSVLAVFLSLQPGIDILRTVMVCLIACPIMGSVLLIVGIRRSAT